MNTRSDRGQTTLDFAVGSSILLISLIAVFVVISGTLSPFTLGGQEDIVVSDRVASSLSEGLLGDPATPHVLNTTCTVDFFLEGATVASGCRYTGPNLTERIGVKNWKNVNVSLRSNLSYDSDGIDTLCWNDDVTPAVFVERDNSTACQTDEIMHVGGSAPDSGGSSVTARRIVSIEGIDATLIVHVW